eukprot:COSAG01_NODE_22644_length_847_cov_1.199198_2_plen_113_part_00
MTLLSAADRICELVGEDGGDVRGLTLTFLDADADGLVPYRPGGPRPSRGGGKLGKFAQRSRSSGASPVHSQRASAGWAGSSNADQQRITELVDTIQALREELDKSRVETKTV